MSKCISVEGEWSDHVFDGETFGSEFICARCFAFDEDSATVEIERLRAAVQQVRALADVARERDRQDAKWGEQNHPDGTGPAKWIRIPQPVLRHGVRHNALEEWARARCEDLFAAGEGTYETILTEEWAEAVASPAGSEELRAELIQVAAVAVAWVEKLDRETAALDGGQP